MATWGSASRRPNAAMRKHLGPVVQCPLVGRRRTTNSGPPKRRGPRFRQFQALFGNIKTLESADKRWKAPQSA
eukprot:984421-Alexandrium_andersonii.AAC.1